MLVVGNSVVLDYSISMLGVLAFSSIGVYGVLLGGYSSNSKYGYMGGIRSTSQMLSYELSIGGLMVML